MKQNIPARLLAKKSDLVIPGNHKVSYNANTWRKWFDGDKDFNDLIRKYPQAISRSEIANLANQVSTKNENTRKVFLATMLWGYGTVGYGAYRTSIMLNDKNSRNTIEKSFNLVFTGKYIEAYKMFSMPMCGAAFFTKYFYFVGLGNKITPLPLILDSVVANSLVKLGIDISQLAKVTKKHGKISSVRKYADGYFKYVEMINNWASEIGCRPDSIEKWLFTFQN